MIDEVKREIERLKRLMVECANERGLNDPEVMLISRKIDELHNYLISLDRPLSNKTRKIGDDRLEPILTT